MLTSSRTDFYLIESLANVQSIVLVTDLNGSDELMTDAFRTFFDVVRCVAVSEYRER